MKQKTKPPAIARDWPVGETVDRAEAVRRVSSAYGIPPWDQALAEGRITMLVNAGWLRREADDRITATEPPPAPTTRTATTTLWMPARTVMRRRRVVDAETGEAFEVDVPVQLPESTEVVTAVDVPA